jgi:YggT family protein
MNINPIIILISKLIGLYNFVLVSYIIMQWLMHFDMINKRNPTVNKIYFALHKMVEPVLSRVRKYIPNFGGIDISPIIVFLLMGFIRDVMFTYFYVR